MNLEPKVTSRGLWWDGHYGGVSKGGQFLMLYIKPNLPFLEPFDKLACFPNAGEDPVYSHKVYRGVVTPLDVDEIEHIARTIESIFPPSGGGGGGGSDPNAVVDIDAIAGHRQQALLLTHADGRTSIIDTAAMVQAVPEFRIGLSMRGSQYHCDYSDHHSIPDGRTKGKMWYIPEEVIKEYVPMPLRCYEKGGTIQGMSVSREEGTFYIPLTGVECTLSMTFGLVLKPYYNNSEDNKIWQGRPVGRWIIHTRLEVMPTGSSAWETIANCVQEHDEIKPDRYPNGFAAGFNANGTRFTFISKQGTYRVLMKLTLGDKPEMFKDTLQGFTDLKSAWSDYDDTGKDPAHPGLGLSLTGKFLSQESTTNLPPIPRLT